MKMPKNRCNCPTPPGGYVDCEPGQVASCTIVNSQVEARCTTPPEGLTRIQLRNWILQEVTGVSRDLNETILSREQQILVNEIFVSSDETRRVNFKYIPLPGQPRPY